MVPAMPPAMRLGIDLGGTKIEIMALDPQGAAVLRQRVPTPRGDYAATLESVAALVLGAERAIGTHGTVGVGIPGALSAATGKIKNANSTWLNGKPLQRDLEKLLDREVRLANDANCFALSEAVDGAGSGSRVVFGVILGTGVGAGIVVDGRVLTGPNAIAGEWGHNPLPLPAGSDLPLPRCYCGRAGCIETYLSGPGMSADHQRVTGVVKTPIDIVSGAGGGDPDCCATVDRFEGRLARALAGVINLLDPDVIVLGGGISNIQSLYASVPKRWGAQVFSDRVDTKLTRNRHGDSSGVRGAAWLWGPSPSSDAGNAASTSNRR